MRLALCLVLGLLGAAPLARADVRDAKRHFEAGGKAYDAGNWATAAEEFEMAIAASPRPELYYNLGKAYDKLGRGVKAAAAYRRYLQGRPEVEDRAMIEELIRRDLEQAGHLDLRIDVPEAKVTVDGEPVGVAPLVGIVDLDAGAHQLVLEKPGALPRTMSVAVAAGQTVKIELGRDTVMAPTPGAAPPPPPSASPSVAAAAPAPGAERKRGTSKLRIPAWTLLAVGGAALGGGIGLGVAAMQDANTLSSGASTGMPPLFGGSGFADTEARGRALAAGGYALDAVAAAALAADVVLWVFARREELRAAGK
jgi:tetratricopeptide (TPR) repeat protein